MEEWPENEYVATCWELGRAGRRIGTRYIKREELPACLNKKGFRIRPKYYHWRKKQVGALQAGVETGGITVGG